MPEPAVDFPKTVPAVKVLLHWTPPSAVVSVTTKSLREHVFVPTTGVLTTPVMAMRETWFWAGLFTSALGHSRLFSRTFSHPRIPTTR